jgi:hexosaminidase
LTSHTFAQLALQLDPWAAGASAKAKAVSLPIPGTEERDYTVSVTQDSSLAPESFSLSVTAGAIDLKAADGRGALYAVNALIQAHNTPDLEYFEAASSPRYPVRGFSFDIARHFYTPAQIMQVIDIIAGYNINRLHLHLTDDQGWRIEIDGRQELTKIAAENDTSGGKGGYLTRITPLCTALRWCPRWISPDTRTPCSLPTRRSPRTRNLASTIAARTLGSRGSI